METKSAPVFPTKSEANLWDAKVLSMDTGLPEQCFSNGKNFCLRGGAEQHALKISQFHKEVVQINGRDVCSYVYNEFDSKNHPGGWF